MMLTVGARLGPYEVIAPVGAGGMGEVYRARDTRLDRLVAIKVLPAAWSLDPDRRARFDREARAVASLSHPNICALYDVGHQDGVHFLVLEYLEGETLAARLERGRPPTIDETLRVATQIADALTAAHRAGVIHRDLKPGNVMLAKTGVKVLDFGLAKRAVVDAAQSVSATSIETAAPLTGIDRIVGTLPYMSPEQIEGRPIDARSDLFAFGAIVYEMVTGRRAFQGTSQASLMAAILERTPTPITTLQPLTPPWLDRLVQKCLAKDPDARWQSAGDIADELRWLATSSATTTAAPQFVSRRRGPRLAWLAAAIGIAGVGGWIWATPQQSNHAPADIVHEQVTFSGNVQAATLSPDGRTVAYATAEADTHRVLVRDFGSGQEVEVWRGSFVMDVEWLPDGIQLAVGGRQERTFGIWIVSRLGGAARRLDAGSTFFGVSPDGKRIAWTDNSTDGVNIAALAGGDSRRIPRVGIARGVEWTRENRVLLPVSTPDGDAVIAGSPDGEQLHTVFSPGARIESVCASPVADAFYVFTGTSLERVTFTASSALTSERLLTGLASTVNRMSSRTCSISADGQRLLHVRRLTYANLWRLDLDRPGPVAVPLTKGTSRYVEPEMSSDGQWTVFSGGPNLEIMRMPLRGGQPIPLTKGTTPTWSPDGQRLAFLSDRNGKETLWVGDADGRRANEQQGAVLSTNKLMTWLPDGRLAWQTTDFRNYQIRDLTTGRDDFLLKTPIGFVFVPRFNPTGDTAAVYWNRNPRGLWLLSWPTGAARFLAADLIPDGWSRDGTWIYAHRAGTRSIVRVASATSVLEPVGDFPVGSLDMNSCHVARDERMMVCSLEETTSDAWVIHHFDDRVRVVR